MDSTPDQRSAWLILTIFNQWLWLTTLKGPFNQWLKFDPGLGPKFGFGEASAYGILGANAESRKCVTLTVTDQPI